MFDVVSMGEVVIDFSLCGKGNMGNPAYEMNPGGAPGQLPGGECGAGRENRFYRHGGERYFRSFPA